MTDFCLPRRLFQVCQRLTGVALHVRLDDRSGARDEFSVEQFPRQSGLGDKGPKRTASPSLAGSQFIKPFPQGVDSGNAVGFGKRTWIAGTFDMSCND